MEVRARLQAAQASSGTMCHSLQDMGSGNGEEAINRRDDTHTGPDPSNDLDPLQEFPWPLLS